ncbi:MAG: hypothetical protein HQK58_09875 [Deltaproteobacteria bacterium]|nr:hypothetical protein [Deltaproteobacteria bacterium]
MITDITEQKLAEDTLQRTHDESELRVAARTSKLAQVAKYVQEIEQWVKDWPSVGIL